MAINKKQLIISFLFSVLAMLVSFIILNPDYFHQEHLETSHVNVIVPIDPGCNPEEYFLGIPFKVRIEDCSSYYGRYDQLIWNAISQIPIIFIDILIITTTAYFIINKTSFLIIRHKYRH